MTPRAYQSPRRSSAAAETRVGILEAALRLFSEGGYSATTVANVAAAAQVAPNTVYASVGGKPQLVLALISAGAADPLIASTLQSVSTAKDGREVLQRLARGVRLTVEVLQPTYAVMYDAAASEPLVAASVLEAEESFRSRLGEVARQLVDSNLTDAELDQSAARDILWFYFGLEPWRSLTSLGWDLDRAERWLTQQASRALLKE